MPQPPERNPDAASNQQLVRALDHPVRVAFLKLLGERGNVSPLEALPLLDDGELALGNLVYHVWVLELLELIEPAAEPGPTGTPFRTTSKGETALMALGFCD